jgi:anti-anti-sigma regulatory factor
MCRNPERWQLQCLSKLGFPSMLKISTKERAGSVAFILEGRLCGAWTVEAELAWSRLLSTLHQEEVVLDLAGVTFIDRAGEALVTAMLGRGTKVRASGVMISHLVEEVQQKVSREQEEEVSRRHAKIR